jgi:hypothetical protein
MKGKRLLLVAAGLVLAVIAMVLLWPAGKPAGVLSVSFTGLTNDASGNRLARFSVHNTFRRRVRFGVGEVQLYQTNGWPNAMRVAGGAAWLSATAGAERVFSVPVPAIEGANWRVPIIYQEDLSFIANVRFRIDLLIWGIARWRPGRPAPFRHGDGFHRSLYAYGPEMSALSSLPVDLTGANRSGQQTNRPPDADGLRR